MIMMTYNDFVESKIAFIRDFMASTRPASELIEFVNAFDTCLPHLCGALPKSEKDDSIFDTTPIPTSTEKPVVLRGRKKSSRPLIHNENTAGVHPKAKMVKVSFMDRVDYYGSITAAANALHVTRPQLVYAIKHKKTVNGQTVELIDQSDVFKK